MALFLACNCKVCIFWSSLIAEKKKVLRISLIYITNILDKRIRKIKYKKNMVK